MGTEGRSFWDRIADLVIPKGMGAEESKKWAANYTTRLLDYQRFLKIDPIPPHIVVATRFSSGFTIDQISWTLTIDMDGNLRQVINISRAENKYRREFRDEKLKLATIEVEEIIKIANELDFQSCEYPPDVIIEDAGTQRISIRLGDHIKTVVADGAGLLAYQGNKDMENFLQLWKKIHSYAPHN